MNYRENGLTDDELDEALVEMMRRNAHRALHESSTNLAQRARRLQALVTRLDEDSANLDRTIAAGVRLQTCSQAGCDRASAYAFDWPGEDHTRGVCTRHSSKLAGVGRALGLNVRLTPIAEELDRVLGKDRGE